MKKLLLLSLSLSLCLCVSAKIYFPTITSFTPVSGTIGSTVVIAGIGFSAVPANNVVCFGAVKATVSACTTTSITVTVPAGAGSIVPISVLADGMMAYSTTSSTPTFNLTNSPVLVPNYATSTVGSGTDPEGVAIGDFNGDGKADMAVVNKTSDGTVTILLGNGLGGFGAPTSYGALYNPMTVAIGDFNKDGKQDLVTANFGSSTVSIFLGDGTGAFGTETSFDAGHDPVTVAIGEFNGDGNTDLVVANYNGAGHVSVLLGDGLGGFGTVTTTELTSGSSAAAVGDFNNDGKADLVVTNDGLRPSTVSILLGDGAGSFSTPTNYFVGEGAWSVAIGDFNGDGKADLAVANDGDYTLCIKLGDGTGGFGASTFYTVGNSPSSVAIADFNGDGITDLAAANYWSDNVSILLGTGSGSFNTAKNFTVGTNPSVVAIGDFDADGKADMVVTDDGSTNAYVFLYKTLTLNWNAHTNSDWNTAGNWNGGIVPTLATDVFISSDIGLSPTINATSQANCNNLTVETGASLTIQSSASGTGSLLVGGTCSGTVTAERYMTGNKWHLVSPMAEGENINSFFQTIENTIPSNIIEGTEYWAMMDYNEAGNAWNSYFTMVTEGNLSAGKGYSVRRSEDGKVSFHGTLMLGPKTVALTKVGTEGWNCVGNPYTTAINMNTTAHATDNFITVNSDNLDASYACVYVWDEDATYTGQSCYKVISNAGFSTSKTLLDQNDVAPGQGFFVKAKTGISTISFTPAMQSHQVSTSLRSSTTSTSWPGITLKAASAKASSSAIIAFNGNMTDGLDPTYDAGLLRGTNGLSLSTRLVEDNGVDFAVQCLPENYDNLLIPVGVDCKVESEITFSAETVDLPVACKVILEDRTNNTFTSLADGATYKTIVAAGSTSVGRFYIRTDDNFITGTAGQTSALHNLNAYASRTSIIIEGGVSDGAIATLYNVQGVRMLVQRMQKGTQNEISCPDLMNGIYLLKIQQDGESVTKKLIKN